MEGLLMLKQVVHILTTVHERVKGCTQHLIGGGIIGWCWTRTRGPPLHTIWDNYGSTARSG